MRPIEEQVEYICKLVCESFQLPVFWANLNRDIVFQLPSPITISPLYAEMAELVRTLISGHVGDIALPFICTTNYAENFVLLPVKPEGRLAGTLVVGPSVYAPFSDENIDGLLYDNRVPKKHRDDWIHYLRKLPAVHKMRLFHIGMLIHYMLNKEEVDITEMLEYNHHSGRQVVPAPNVDLSLSDRRSQSTFHMDPLIEKKLFQHIRNGDRTGLIKALNNVREEELGVLSRRSQIRSLKNLSYCAITLATRAAVEGGLFWEKAYTLSDMHIQHIEELTESKDVEKAYKDALLDFADQVRKNRMQKVSKPVAVCQNYIFNHLYEEITLSRLSEITGLNASYLSQLFKKETGITITRYIQREKVKEAGRLLVLTDCSLADICSRLNFCDQTYFNKVFKKHTGMTPKQYRNHRGLELLSY